jgi:hypothetical protein
MCGARRSCMRFACQASVALMVLVLPPVPLLLLVVTTAAGGPATKNPDCIARTWSLQTRICSCILRQWQGASASQL